MCNEQTFGFKSRVRRDVSRRHDELCILAMVCGFIAAFAFGCEESALIEQSMKIEAQRQAINGDGEDANLKDITDWDDEDYVGHRRAMCYIVAGDYQTGYFSGSGVSVGPYHVLTVAHVVSDGPYDPLPVNKIVFSYDHNGSEARCKYWSDESRTYELFTGSACNNSAHDYTDILIPDGYVSDSGDVKDPNDIALIRLKRSLSRNINLDDNISYGGPYYDLVYWAGPDNDEKAEIFGYGTHDCSSLHNDDGSEGSGYLRMGWNFDIDHVNDDG